MKSLSVVFAVLLAVVACVPTNSPNAGNRSPSGNNSKSPTPTPFGNQYRYPTPTPAYNPWNPNPTWNPNSTSNPNPTVNPGNGTCIEADAATCAAEEQATALTNQIRAQAGRPALRHDAKFSAVARYWSKWQHDGRCKPSFFGPEVICHDGFTEGTRAQIYYQKFGSQPNFFAENVAMTGYASSPSSAASELINMWRNSSGHYQNMVGDYSVMGNGIYCGSNGCFGTQIFGN